MNERAQAQRNEQAFRQYVQQTAAGSQSTADELAKLADRRDRGTISEQEFVQAKARLLGAKETATIDSNGARTTSVG